MILTVEQLVERLQAHADGLAGIPAIAQDISQAAATITRLVEDVTTLTEASNAYAHQAAKATIRATSAEAQVAELTEALKAIVADYDACSGAEPSLSVLHRSIDVDARRALEQSK